MTVHNISSCILKMLYHANMDSPRSQRRGPAQAHCLVTTRLHTTQTNKHVANHVANILAPLVGNTSHHIQNSLEFVNKVRGKVQDKSVSYDVTSLFSCIPTMESVKTDRYCLQHDNTLHNRANLNPEPICEILDLCPNTTFFQFSNKFYRQWQGCAIGSTVSPIVAIHT